MRTFTSAILPRKRRPTASRTGLDDEYQAGELRRLDTAGSPAVEEDKGGVAATFYRAAASEETAECEAPAVVSNGAVERTKLAEYARRLPVRVPFLGRADPEDAPVDGAPDLWSLQASQEPSVASESVLDNNASSGLIKRVSSMPGNLSLFRAHLIDPLRHPEFYAAPRYTRNQPMRLPANDPDTTPAFGYALLALTVVVFVASMYALVVSKFMPYTGMAFVDAVKDDRYFCLLMPITGLSFVFVVFWNWIGMKFFRHN